MSLAPQQTPSQSGQMWEKYTRAERFLPWNADLLTSDLSIKPHWIDSGGRFWYRFRNRSGAEFVLVDLKNETRALAFDHQRLAAALSAASGTAYSASQLPFNAIEFIHDGNTIAFDLLDPPSEAGQRWNCDLSTYTCALLQAYSAPPSSVVRSPDSQWDAIVRDHNVWLRSVSTGDERDVSHDGIAQYGYGYPLLSPLTSAGIMEAPPPTIFWSPDSKKLLFCRVDEREALQFHLVQSVPKDGSIRPRLHSYSYPLPGDETLPTVAFFIADVSEGTLTRVDIEPLPLLYHGAPMTAERVWWSDDSRSVYLIRRGRAFVSYSLTAVDATTGAARVIVEEESKRGIDLSLEWNKTNIRVFGGGSQVIWYSQRDGWGHLYLYAADTGALQCQLTSGAYAVDEVMYVDDTAGYVYFTALGREPDRDPYLAHLYRVRLTGGEPDLLTPEDADHTVVIAPGGHYFVDTYSTVQQPPVIVLRAADGRKVCDLEQADVTALLAMGWQAPERFQAKARDGVTDVYGVIFRPSTVDPAQQYPVIDNIYAGPQTNQAPVSFADSAQAREDGFWQAQALAELGFIVVMIDGLGMPGRSKAYHDASYHDLGDAGLQDHIAALRQLADRYPYLDLSRVGIYGHSAGGYASARAILTFPDFYKVCVSSAGNHDHRLDKAVWVERYMGFPVEDHYRQQANQTNAHNLKGKLLLIHGEMDENVHVSSTMVVVDELIKADKDFDLLIMPNQPHACTNHAYFIRRRWDYFVRHLLGIEPPMGYRIKGDNQG